MMPSLRTAWNRLDTFFRLKDGNDAPFRPVVRPSGRVHHLYLLGLDNSKFSDVVSSAPLLRTVFANLPPCWAGRCAAKAPDLGRRSAADALIEEANVNLDLSDAGDAIGPKLRQNLLCLMDPMQGAMTQQRTSSSTPALALRGAIVPEEEQ